jgi:hypothetical protein
MSASLFLDVCFGGRGNDYHHDSAGFLSSRTISARTLATAWRPPSSAKIFFRSSRIRLVSWSWSILRRGVWELPCAYDKSCLAVGQGRLRLVSIPARHL